MLCFVVDDDDDDSDEEANVVPKNSACNVVWEGKVMDRGFSDWKVSY